MATWPTSRVWARCVRQADALLVLDDAHAVFGEGLAAGGATACLRVGTLSRGARLPGGGYVAGPRSWIDLLINRARSFIFTTGLAPTSAAAARAALDICRSTEGDARRGTLRAHIQTVRPGHSTPIIPVMIGSESDALDAADILLRCALLVPAIRPPTVPAGTSRLRVSLSAAHSEDDVARLVEALGKLA